MDIRISDKYLEMMHDPIVNALFETYESIYAVDAETSVYWCFHESDSYSLLRLENHGEDFFEALETNILKAIYKDDQEYVRQMLCRETMDSALKKARYYSFVYRLVIDGQPLYHKFRATTGDMDGRPHYLIGIRNVDNAFRQDRAQAEALSSMHTKEITHLEAILASADGYMEVNLSRDRILEASPDIARTLARLSQMQTGGEIPYTAFEQWKADHQVLENREKFLQISHRDYLIRCFESGEKRASVSYSARAEGEKKKSQKKVFYLYRDAASGDVLAFCVLYDLTEQQCREKELKELEEELKRSRIRNFTSQMQPHFLFNALGSIQEIVLEDPEYASELLGDFTTHLRSCIRAMSSDVPIPFDQELDNIRAYVNIERMRFGEKLKVLYDIRAEEFSVLPLSIQPIVENAIRHGIYERGEQGGTVYVRTEETPDAWRITVEDTGIGFDVDAFFAEMHTGKRDSTGLKNIMFRLDVMMHASVEISSRVGTGTVVTVVLPKEGRNNESDHSR